ncbi:MAG TPA: hypothetical protein DCE42_19385 [Myxococcales bacterium]|nr:hypothetical protein [Deltaproteobacteria bacterium]MBU53494.1 hypothetical protein [Deltaproteobacteria bacterium]HAA56938.1 hypothetical protein [Myxococcales bacterium]
MAENKLVQFAEFFDGWQYPFSTINEGDFIAHARDIARKVFPDWNIDAPGDVGFFALRLYIKALVQGVNLANAFAQEFSLFTAREEKMIIAHAKKAGYTPKSATPARVDLLVTLPSPYTARTFNQYALKVTNRNIVGEVEEVFFENELAFSVGSGVSQVSVSMIAGRSLEQGYTSDGTKFQAVILNEPLVIDGSVRVKVLGVFWNKVDSLVDSGATDKHFTTSLRTDGKTQIEFGDGANGVIPTALQSVEVFYRVGGGLESNVPKDNLTYVFESPSPAPSSVTNPLRAKGGEPKDSKTEIVKKAQLRTRTREFLGTLKEIDTFSELFSGIARAKSVLIGDQIIVGIVPSGGGTATPSLKSALRSALEPKIGMGFFVQVDDPAFVVPVIDVLFTTKQGFISAEVELAVVADLQKLLDPLTTQVDRETQEVSFLREAGQTLHVNEIRGVLAARSEVENDFVIRSPVADIPVPSNAFVTNEGATIIATSRNVQTVGYTP